MEYLIFELLIGIGFIHDDTQYGLLGTDIRMACYSLNSSLIYCYISVNAKFRLIASVISYIEITTIMWI